MKKNNRSKSKTRVATVSSFGSVRKFSRFRWVRLAVVVIAVALLGRAYTFLTHAATPTVGWNGSICVDVNGQAIKDPNGVNYNETQCNALKAYLTAISKTSTTPTTIPTNSDVPKTATGWNGSICVDVNGQAIKDPNGVNYNQAQCAALKSFLTAIANPAPDTSNRSAPIGSVDNNSCMAISGWAYDKDQSATAIQVHIYIDGVGYNTGPTNGNRTDVNGAEKITGNHGYNFTVPAKWRDGKPHTAVVYAININAAGAVSGTNATINSKEWACNYLGQDLMPQITADRMKAFATYVTGVANLDAARQAEAQAQQIAASHPILRMGSTGPAVISFQQRLANRGFWLTVDGAFGPNTEHWVKAFQLEMAIPYSGIVDNQTYDMMSNAERDNWHYNPNDPNLQAIAPPAPAPASNTRNDPTVNTTPTAAQINTFFSLIPKHCEIDTANSRYDIVATKDVCIAQASNPTYSQGMALVEHIYWDHVLVFSKAQSYAAAAQAAQASNPYNPATCSTYVCTTR